MSAVPRWTDVLHLRPEVVARRGHMTLLPAGAAYRFHAEAPGVILMQTIEGPDTVFKWAEIVQTTP